MNYALISILWYNEVDTDLSRTENDEKLTEEFETNVVQFTTSIQCKYRDKIINIYSKFEKE
jgi:hypothetical protein